MIIKLSILIILILGAFAFLGIKLSSSLKDLKFLFLVLYGVSIFTVCNIILSIYFFVSLRNKRGSPGPKGKTGPMGDKGIDGDCGSEGDEKEINCLKKSLVAIIIDTLEDNLQTKYKEEDANYKAATDDTAADNAKKRRDSYIPLQGFEKNAICSYVNGIVNKTKIKKLINNNLDILTHNIKLYFVIPSTATATDAVTSDADAAATANNLAINYAATIRGSTTYNRKTGSDNFLIEIKDGTVTGTGTVTENVNENVNGILKTIHNIILESSSEQLLKSTISFETCSN